MRLRGLLLASVLVFVQQDARPDVSAASLTRAGLPSPEAAKTLLSAALATTRHPQWIDIPAGATSVRSFVVFPERADGSAPVVVITANNQGMTDWLRAVGDDAAANGFIAIVPDLSAVANRASGSPSQHWFVGSRSDPTSAEAERRTAAVDQYARTMPGSNGRAANVRFSFTGGSGRIDTAIDSALATSYELTDHAWHRAIASLSAALDGASPSTRDARSGQGQAAPAAPAAAPGGMTSKRADLPANFLMAAKTVAQSPRKGAWVDIPMPSGTKLHTWISSPQNVARAPVVLIFQPGPGMDMGEPPVKGGGANWLRAIADQLASEGFIGVLPDLTSGLGPNGGNYDSFQFPDDSARAINRISHAEVLNRIRAARDYALKLPMANGRLGATGFCMGGGLAWEAAAEIEGVNASVVFYGAPPAENVMARIKAPVAAFFGANDLGLAPRVAPATADMKRLGKEFTVQVYPEATHVFLYRQDLGRNMAATEDAWPRAMAFLKRHLVPSASF